MDNMAVYKKTIGFSLRRLGWDFLSLLILAAASGAGFLIADKTTNKGLIGLAIGLVIGIVILVVIVRWTSYQYKAGQIAMMTRGVTEGSLPDDDKTRMLLRCHIDPAGSRFDLLIKEIEDAVQLLSRNGRLLIFSTGRKAQYKGQTKDQGSQFS